jgi:hypothetical protein
MYAGDDKEECLIGTWIGKKSVEVLFNSSYEFGIDKHIGDNN